MGWYTFLILITKYYKVKLIPVTTYIKHSSKAWSRCHVLWKSTQLKHCTIPQDLTPRLEFTNDKTDKFLSLLTAAKPHLRPCPYLGRYIVTGLSRERHANSRPNGGAHDVSDTETSITQCNDLQFQSLTVGCTEVNTMQFHSSCSVAETSSKFS